MGVKNSLFQTSISKSDWQSLQKFNSAIKVTNDGLTKSQRITKAWNENMTGCSMAAKRMGNDLITGKKKISDVSNSMKTATASTKALGVAMNIFANVGFMLAITAVTKVVTELAQAQSKAVETAHEATESYKEELVSLEDYKTKISELHEELNSENISYEDSKTIREELLALQDELIEKYGNEKNAIENITTAIKGEVNALDELNEKAYRDWVAKADKTTFWNMSGKSGLDQAIDYMETKKTVSFLDMSNANDITQDKYQAPITDEIRSIQKEIDKTIQSKYNLEKEFATFKLIGTPDEIKSQLESIRQDYLDLSKEAFLKNGISSEYWEAYRSEAINSINEIINKFDDGLEKHQETYKTYIEGMIKYDSEYSDEYATILQKRAALESAENSGNVDNIQKARQEFMDAINNGIQASGSNENIKKYFESLYPELQSEFSDWAFEFDLKANVKGLNDVANEIGEKYSATDLLDMINTEGTQEGEESFNKLIDKAIEYGVCTDKSAEKVQKLIDLLVELGIVQDNVQGSTSNNEISILPTTQILSQIQSLSAGLDQLDKIYADVYDKEDFDWSSILNNEDFEKTFGELGQTYDDFIEKISNAPDDISACQEAFDNLVTSYIYSAKDENGNSIMSNLTEETKDATIAMLEQMGVENAAEVVTSALAYKEKELASEKILLANTSRDLTNVTGTEISQLEAEGVVTNETAQEMLLFALQKQTANLTTITTSADIANLGSLCTALAATGLECTKLSELINLLNGNTIMPNERRQNIINAIQSEIQDIMSGKGINMEVPVGFSGGSATNSAKDKASKGSSGSKEKEKKETKQEFDFVERKLDNLSKKTEDLGDAFEDAYSIDDKDKAYINYLSAIQEEIDANNTAIDFYQQKLNEIGLSYEWIAKIQQGAFDISTITDQTLIDQIQQYQSIYDKILGLQDNVQALEQKRQKAEADHAKDVVETYEKEIDAFQKVIDKRKALVDLKETFGFSASKSDLKAEQDAYNRQINRIEEQNRGLIELMKTTTYGSEAWQIYNDKLEDNRDSVYDLIQSLADLATEIANLPLDKLDKYLDKHSETNELYDAKIENATSAKSKNKLINKQISLTKKDNNKTKATAKETKKNLSDSIKGFKTAKNTDKKYAPSDQQAKIDAYYKKIQSYTKSKKQIPSSLITQLAEEGHSNLAQAAANYNAALVANETAQATAKLTAETTKTQIAELAKAKFDNIQTEYERKQNAINSKANIWSSKMDLSQAKGYLDSEIWYNQLIAYEQKNQSSLQKEANALQSRLDKAVTAGNIEKYSDEWWDMTEAISAINEELEKGKVTLQEYKNQLDQIKFDNFDYVQEQISRLTSESDFYIKLMANKDLTDENGLTNYGIATLGLHYQNYDTLLAQAQKYGDEIAKINEKLANDSNNTTLIAQLQEYEDAQRDCILAAEEEKNAVIELKKQGYDALIDSLSDVIDKYKEFIRNAKDAYDYQNNIAEQSDNISSLEKKIAAYSSMSGNEEIASKIQQTQKDLTKAQKDLEETMYEKYVSDTEDMLDDLLDELEEFTNELYNNLSQEFEASRQLAEDNANTINDTLIGLSSSYGVALSSAIQNVWGNGYTPEKGVQTITDKIDELIDASNAQADQEADALVYNDVKDKYNKSMSSYEASANSASDSYNSAIANKNNINNAYKSAKQESDKLKKERDLLKAQRDAIGKEFGKNSVQYKNANDSYSVANNKYTKAKQKTDQLKQELEIAKQNELYTQQERDRTQSEYGSVLASNKNVVQDFLNRIVNATSSKPEDKMTELDMVIKQIAGGYIEDYNIQQLANLLGVSANENDILAMLQKLGFSWMIPNSAMKIGTLPVRNGFKTGGIATVDSGTLKKTGEDGWVLARNGEGFVSPENVQDIRNLMKVVPDMTKLINVSVPDYSNLIASRNVGVGDVNITFGDLTLPDVTNSAEFASSVKGIMRDAMCNDNKTIKCMTEVVSSQQLGKGIGRANLYRR